MSDLAYPPTAEQRQAYLLLRLLTGLDFFGHGFARIFTGYALDPVNNLLNEFLPDVASRVHIRVIFVQRILNNIASNNGTGGT